MRIVYTIIYFLNATVKTPIFKRYSIDKNGTNVTTIYSASGIKKIV
jgi:hypothetical protein